MFTHNIFHIYIYLSLIYILPISFIYLLSAMFYNYIYTYIKVYICICSTYISHLYSTFYVFFIYIYIFDYLHLYLYHSLQISIYGVIGKPPCSNSMCIAGPEEVPALKRPATPSPPCRRPRGADRNADLR